MAHTSAMKRRSWIVLVVVIVIVAVAALIVWQRMQGPCSGFAGPSVTKAELPPPPRAGDLRISAWNIRNFPRDDRPQYPDLGYLRRTNFCDLEKVLAGLDADVLGVEEIHKPRLFMRLFRKVEGRRRYRSVFSRGGGRWGQHVGIVWDSMRLHEAAKPVEVTSVALDASLRPAEAVYLRSTRSGGIDFTVVEVHLRAGPRGYSERLEQYRRIARWVNAWVQKTGDQDVVVQGDFNTTGPENGSVAQEVAAADSILATAHLRRLVNARGCSEYWEGANRHDGIQVPALLDRVYVRGMEELNRSVELETWLHCARMDCRPLVSRPGAEDGTFWDVSDHCPLTFEVRDCDLDTPGIPCGS